MEKQQGMGKWESGTKWIYIGNNGTKGWKEKKRKNFHFSTRGYLNKIPIVSALFYRLGISMGGRRYAYMDMYASRKSMRMNFSHYDLCLAREDGNSFKY
ncbi:hypothetical protein JTE90_000307 [Oedothorax gibbosus]|uniref:Uncharacterized protein n=1 Tax=Oedothorax gibbosus TaxID=931172 RepID=A0AAV6VRW8_9ARAC|nr:hypothetical protein JTE90_000307 [Oedothorax gibbosus]